MGDGLLTMTTCEVIKNRKIFVGKRKIVFRRLSISSQIVTQVRKKTIANQSRNVKLNKMLCLLKLKEIKNYVVSVQIIMF